MTRPIRFLDAIRLAGTCVTLLCASAGLMAQNPGGATVRATHILGFESIPNNATGNLFVRDHALHFQKPQGPEAQVSVTSIRDVSVGEQDKQIGGTALAVGRAATPYGGGRVIALFSHKKYDTVTVEYTDSSGGLHGAIFQLLKGQAQTLRNDLHAEGAHISEEDSTAKPTSPGGKE